MALANYTELQTAVADFLNRDDLSSAIPDFIKLAEAKFNRAIRNRRMLTRATVTIDAQYENLPADFLESKLFILNDSTPYAMQLATLEQAAGLRFQRDNTAGKPAYYSVTGSQFEFTPSPDAAYTADLTYYAKIPDLATNSTNWLLTNFPDLYLYTTLIQSAPYLKDDERLMTWTSLANAGFEELKLEDERAQYNASPLLMRIRRPIG